MTEGDIILRHIENMIPEFQHKYEERPRFVKIPLWAERRLKDYAKELLTNFHYNDLEEEDDFTVFGLRVCGTLTINLIDEIEVF